MEDGTTTTTGKKDYSLYDLKGQKGRKEILPARVFVKVRTGLKLIFKINTGKNPGKENEETMGIRTMTPTKRRLPLLKRKKPQSRRESEKSHGIDVAEGRKGRIQNAGRKRNRQAAKKKTIER